MEEFFSQTEVSIHAPTWGATSRRGACGGVYGVSIHAPTWGATTGTHTGLCIGSFNPRAHVGRDAAALRKIHRPDVSIHAPTWGATLYLYPLSSGRHVSIHAPTWGATRFLSPEVASKEFQSTRPRGARQTGCLLSSVANSFNPRAHVGRDVPGHAAALPNSCFNPRAHVGRDLD